MVRWRGMNVHSVKRYSIGTVSRRRGLHEGSFPRRRGSAPHRCEHTRSRLCFGGTFSRKLPVWLCPTGSPRCKTAAGCRNNVTGGASRTGTFQNPPNGAGSPASISCPCRLGGSGPRAPRTQGRTVNRLPASAIFISKVPSICRVIFRVAAGPSPASLESADTRQVVEALEVILCENGFVARGSRGRRDGRRGVQLSVCGSCRRHPPALHVGGVLLRGLVRPRRADAPHARRGCGVRLRAAGASALSRTGKTHL